MLVMNRIYITGDKHGDFSFLNLFCEFNKTTKNDILIILGDSGINYYVKDNQLNIRNYTMQIINDMPITLLCINGNHEERPKNLDDFEKIKMFDGDIWRHKEYKNILFFNQYGEYTINNKKILVIGGAYSIDKEYRLRKNYNWFNSEQLTKEEMNDVINISKNKKYDYVLTHTCPISIEPFDLYISSINQKDVDKSMEKLLYDVYNNIDFKKWYFGHFHDDRNMHNKFTMLYDKIIMLGESL